jgi:outer membrane protein OmpA-like peptidoglycan-associated protein
MSEELAPGPISLFYSYSHKDESLRDELAKHLTILKQAGFIREWHDRQILAGEEWDRKISIYLEAAEVILLLISADFLASKYCYDIEAKRALDRHSSGTACVIPIILRPVLWKLAPFAALKALPKDARAVTEWPNRDLAFVNICEGILAVVVGWKDSASRSGSSEDTIVDRPVSRKVVRARKRLLDAALPRRVLTGKATTLVVMLRREDSSGLRTIVEMDTSYGVQKEDVRSTESFSLWFPVDANKRLAPFDLDLKIDAPDFAPQVQSRSISVPPRGDSEPRVFLLTPKREGELVLTVRLCLQNKEIATCVLRTNAEASEREITPGGHSLVSIPLKVEAEESALLVGEVLETAPLASASPAAARKESVQEGLEGVRPPWVHVAYDVEAGAVEGEAQARERAEQPQGRAERERQERERAGGERQAKKPQEQERAEMPLPSRPGGAKKELPVGADTGAYSRPVPAPAPATAAAPPRTLRHLAVAAALAMFLTLGSLTYWHQAGKQSGGTANLIQKSQAELAALSKRFGELGDYDVKATATVYFAVNSSRVDVKGKQDLRALATQAGQFGGHYLIQVAAYTDSSGNAQYNQQLSDKRAHAVIAYLQQSCGVPLFRVLSPPATGMSSPAAANESAKGMAENRRVVVKVLVNKGLAKP